MIAIFERQHYVNKIITMSQHLKVSTKNFIRTILIDNPKKKNAWNRAVYVGLKVLLNEADRDDNVKCVVITGGGTTDYYR